MQKYKTIADFSGNGVMPAIEAIVTAVPVFFDVMLFVVWIFVSGASYFAILKATGRKRFWHSLTAVSFIIFLMSLIISAMNTTTTTYLNGYWIGFYILISLGSWYMLSNYK